MNPGWKRIWSAKTLASVSFGFSGLGAILVAASWLYQNPLVMSETDDGRMLAALAAAAFGVPAVLFAFKARPRANAAERGATSGALTVGFIVLAVAPAMLLIGIGQQGGTIEKSADHVGRGECRDDRVDFKVVSLKPMPNATGELVAEVSIHALDAAKPVWPSELVINRGPSRIVFQTPPRPASGLQVPGIIDATLPYDQVDGSSATAWASMTFVYQLESTAPIWSECQFAGDGLPGAFS